MGKLIYRPEYGGNILFLFLGTKDRTLVVSEKNSSFSAVISELLNLWKKKYSYENAQSKHLDLKLELAEISLHNYLSNSIISSSDGSYNSKSEDYKKFKKLEIVLYNHLVEYSEQNPSYINFKIQPSDYGLEETIRSLFEMNKLYENNFEYHIQNEANEDMTFLLQWKLSLLDKLILKNDIKPIIFRKSEVKYIEVVNGTSIDIILGNKRIPLEFSSFKLERR